MSENSLRGLSVFKIQRSCFYDGPGIRTTIFFQGCNLRCLWCQNPEGQPFKRVGMGGEKVAEEYSMEEIIEIALRDKNYYLATGGGITLSGGEPFLQDSGSLVKLLRRFKEEGISVVAETSLHAPWSNIEAVLGYIDLFLVDLKVVGDEELHKEFTGQDTRVIYSNLKKLIESDAKIKFRMVMVPGYTDSEANIRAAADFLKAHGYNSLEILKYHNLYEDKAERFGLEVPKLNITAEQSMDSIKRAIRLFERYGIKPYYIEFETEKRKPVFSKRVRMIERDIRRARRWACAESCKLKTRYYMRHGFNKPTPIHRAESLAYILKKKKIKVYRGELLVGNYTSKRVAGQMWVEYVGVIGLKMVPKAGFLRPIKFKVSLIDGFHFVIGALYWLNHSVVGKMFYDLKDILPVFGRTSDMYAGFNNNYVAISHFIVNFERVLKLGTSGIIKEIMEEKKYGENKDSPFYDGAIIALKGLEEFAHRYAVHLEKLSKKERDSQRRRELEEMAEICRHVPKYPARTFHEALQCMLFVHIALCNECYENAISFGRVDQILYPYYKADLEAGRITYERARELICLFVLKMDECILVNDGETFLELFKLFETVSTDQAITFGGVDKDGNDATNDVTYMLLDACELKPLCADLAARVHKNSPPKYLERIARVYLNGTPIPQLFSDEIYINTLLKHYPISIEDARDYAIVGCVEPNANDDHYGNTDCANINLAMPFLQALKGVDYDLWNYSIYEGFLKLFTNFIKFKIKGKSALGRLIRYICDRMVYRYEYKKGRHKYNPPSTMEELLDRFEKQLNKLARSILNEHKKLEIIHRKYFQAPLASSLYRGCIKRGKDVYDGGATINSSGIQAVGVTDVADSLYALEEVVFKRKKYPLIDVIYAIENNFQGEYYSKIRQSLLAVPKFGDDSLDKPVEWMNKVLEIYNKALASRKKCSRNGIYSAGYYALNVASVYGRNTPALPSGRLKGVPLANGLIPHYGMEESDLFSALNCISKLNFINYAPNGATATLTIDTSLFQGKDGVKNLTGIFKTFLTNGGMELQPNVIDRDILIDAYHHPEKYPNLLVRIAGYCAFFNELSDQMKLEIINRTCYSFKPV
ncbi:MAG: pyruvate formate lyase family protein [Promethearchaeota archaeon]